MTIEFTVPGARKPNYYDELDKRLRHRENCRNTDLRNNGDQIQYKIKPMTDEIKRRIETEYKSSSKCLDLKLLSSSIGISRQMICRYAKKIGLTNYRRRKNPMRIIPKQNWGGPYSRTVKGKRPDTGDIFFKSRWEANFARYLNLLKRCGNIHRWEYEADRFIFDKIKRGTTSYLPDFKVWDSENSEPYYYEIKGWMDDKSRVRLNRMRIYYPKIRLIVISAKEYRDIAVKVSSLIPKWEK